MIIITTMIRLVFAIILWQKVTLAVVVLREQHKSGPAAIRAGTECLQELTKAYFHAKSRTHVANLAIIFSRGLSSPAAEIPDEYLKWLHDHALDATGDER